MLGPFASYTIEKKIAKDPSRFGKGAIEGVAGPESANNAGAQTAFIPLLTLGIPPNAVMALMVGAMTIHGIIPGPQVMTKNPELFWGMIASMWIGNLMLLIINLPLVGLWVKLLQVPYRLMFPAILIFCCIGIYSVNNQPIDVAFTAMFGLFGYLLIKLGFEPAPMLLGLRARQADGGEAAPGPDHLARLVHDLRRAADLGRSAARRRARARDRGAAAVDQQEARRSLHRMTGLPERDRNPSFTLDKSQGGPPMKKLTLGLAAALSLALAAGASAQAYPTKPITMIVPFAAGGPTDIIARIVGDHMSQDARPAGRDRERRRRRRHHRHHPRDHRGAGRLHHRDGPSGHLLGSAGDLSRPEVRPRPTSCRSASPAARRILIVAKKNFPAKDLKEFVAT